MPETAPRRSASACGEESFSFRVGNLRTYWRSAQKQAGCNLPQDSFAISLSFLRIETWDVVEQGHAPTGKLSDIGMASSPTTRKW
jgi:hypothetical protein